MERHAHRVVDAKRFHEGKGRLISVDASLCHHPGNTHPYFSVTGTIYRPGARDIEAGGCLHDEVLTYWPELAPVVKLHLCTDYGAPMHALENGLYFLGATRWEPYDREKAAHHFRITPEEADALRDKIAVHHSENSAGYWIREHDPDAYQREVSAMFDRWAVEAEGARQILMRMQGRANGVRYPFPLP